MEKRGIRQGGERRGGGAGGETVKRNGRKWCEVERDERGSGKRGDKVKWEEISEANSAYVSKKSVNGGTFFLLPLAV